MGLHDLSSGFDLSRQLPVVVPFTVVPLQYHSLLTSSQGSGLPILYEQSESHCNPGVGLGVVGGGVIGGLLGGGSSQVVEPGFACKRQTPAVG